MRMLHFSKGLVEPAAVQQCFKKPFESTAASPSVCATMEQGQWDEVVGIEGDGCAVPFQGYVDNDLITFEAPTEQEIIKSLAGVDNLALQISTTSWRTLSKDNKNYVFYVLMW